jgi:hypothetical protein
MEENRMPDHQSVPPIQQVQVSSVPAPLTVQYASRTVMVHQLTNNELETVASISNSVHLTFFGLCTGGVISFGIVLAGSAIAEPKQIASYVALFAVSSIGSLYFGIRAVIDYRRAKDKLREIKRGS